MRQAMVALAVGMIAAAAAAAPRPERVKLAFWNIKSGQGAPGVRGHAATFAETNDCEPAANKPMNAWGAGVVPRELKRLADDPEVVALGLAEAWNCASPGKVMRALGWKHHTEERNGTGLITRYGIAGRDEWIQLDTSRNKNPKDSMFVVRAAVCLDARCGSTLDVYMTHWYGTGAEWTDTLDKQAQDSVRFMSRSKGPHALLGDLNVWEGPADVCHQQPDNTTLNVLRHAGYVDAWAALHPGDPGFTGMLNRNGCGSPNGAPWKRIDYAWSKGLTPGAVERFGLPDAGEDAPSDHTGIVATYRF